MIAVCAKIKLINNLMLRLSGLPLHEEIAKKTIDPVKTCQIYEC